MAARASGSKIVGVAVGLTVAAVGVGSIYLPFFADRDSIRGLYEEESPPTAAKTSAMLAQEIAKLQQEGILRQNDDTSQTNVPGSSSSSSSSGASSSSQPNARAPGSMWKNMK